MTNNSNVRVETSKLRERIQTQHTVTNFGCSCGRMHASRRPLLATLPAVQAFPDRHIRLARHIRRPVIFGGPPYSAARHSRPALHLRPARHLRLARHVPTAGLTYFSSYIFAGPYHSSDQANSAGPSYSAGPSLRPVISGRLVIFGDPSYRLYSAGLSYSVGPSYSPR